LNPDYDYFVGEGTDPCGGDHLMQVGLTIPFSHGDFTSNVFRLRASLAD